MNKLFDNHVNFFRLVVVVHEADLLSSESQAALRRTMELYMSNVRLILCCKSPSKIIDPIRSRCLLIRIPAPTIDEVIQYIFTPCIY